MANCNHYYFIDALNADGEVVRKRKYRREDSKIQTWWYDWKDLPISDATEIARVEALATTHTQVDEGFEDWGDFTMKRNRVSSIEGLPMDAHIIEVLWAPDGFVQGSDNGSPTTPMQKIYVLVHNYNQSWTLKPETTSSRVLGARGRTPKFRMAVIDGRLVISTSEFVTAAETTPFKDGWEGLQLALEKGFTQEEFEKEFNELIMTPDEKIGWPDEGRADETGGG